MPPLTKLGQPNASINLNCQRAAPVIAPQGDDRRPATAGLSAVALAKAESKNKKDAVDDSSTAPSI